MQWPIFVTTKLCRCKLYPSNNLYGFRTGVVQQQSLELAFIKLKTSFFLDNYILSVQYVN